jgi:hypothetical protein
LALAQRQKAAAEAYRDEIAREVKFGKFRQLQVTTFKELWTLFDAQLVGPVPGPATIADYRSVAVNYLLPELGSKRCGQAVAQHPATGLTQGRAAAAAIPGSASSRRHADVRSRCATEKSSGAFGSRGRGVLRWRSTPTPPSASTMIPPTAWRRWRAFPPRETFGKRVAPEPEETELSACSNGSLGWNRTNDQRINSPTLYR